MKIIELLNGISIPITNDEKAVLKKFNHENSILRKDLDIFEIQQIEQLVRKNIVVRKKIEGKTAYVKK